MPKNLAFIKMYLILFFVLWCPKIFSQSPTFEGYYKIMSQGEHIGYTIHRYTFLPNGHLQTTSFTKTSPAGGNIHESVITLSDSDLKPISLKYTALLNQEPMTIDVELKNQLWSGTIVEKRKSRSINKKYEPGIFFSSVLIYAIMKSPEGLKAPQKFQYKAIAEENLETVSATAMVEEQTLFRNKIPAFKIVNDFKGHKFISYVTLKGEVLLTEAPTLQLSSELVPTPDKATQGQVLPVSAIRNIFGDLPKGEFNIAFQSNQKGEWPEPPAPKPVEMSKTKGVPPGKGIRVKNKSK